MRLSAPINAQLELTDRCNIRCFHCYNYWRNQEEDLKITECTVEQYLNIVSTLNKHGVQDLVITGGEPLLRWDTLLAITRHARSCGMQVSINTNAVLMTESRALDLFAAGVKWVVVSLTGSSETHQFITNAPMSYQGTITGITRLVTARLPVAVNMVVSRYNLNEVFSTAQIVSSLGVTSFCASPMVPGHPDHLGVILSTDETKHMLRELMRVERELHLKIGVLSPLPRCMFSPDEDDEFIQFFGNRKCSAGVTTCSISPNGEVRPCPHADISYGNMLQEDFSTIWKAMSIWSCPDILPEVCRSCNANVVCEGGCRMAAKITGGEYNSPDPRMGEPIQDMTRVSKMTSSPGLKILQVKESDQFSFREGCRFRAEEFGGIVVSSKSASWLTHEGFELLKQLSIQKTFSVVEFMRSFSITFDEAQFRLSVLQRQGVIQQLAETNPN